MEANILQRIESEDVIFFVENEYSNINRDRYMEVFRSMVEDGAISGAYMSDRWEGFSGVRRFGIYFELDAIAYQSHFGKTTGIPYSTMQDVLRCYALYIMGCYIFRSINEKLQWIRSLLTCYGEHRFKLPAEALATIHDFLCFIGTPELMIEEIEQSIHTEKSVESRPRELSHLINYLAVANEINNMYRGPISDEEFRRWFPIFFWTNVTFVIPLRATEMLVTPLNCISRNRGKTCIKLRRTLLKKGGRAVYHDVERDYTVYTYEIPDTWVVEMIERYQELTAGHKRSFLFDHSKYMINRMVSLASFNLLLEEFVSTYLIGNPKYDYARFATGISEFECITAGDSRPIALANLYYQDVPTDILQQIAIHCQAATTYSYYTNTSKTIECAAIMRIQSEINKGRTVISDVEKAVSKNTIQINRTSDKSQCTSHYKPLITGDIRDCIKENHIHECMGCKYYIPTEEEVRKELEKRRKRLDDISQQFLTGMIQTKSGCSTKADVDQLLLDVHTRTVRFGEVCDEYAKEAEFRWQRYRSTQKRNSQTL